MKRLLFVAMIIGALTLIAKKASQQREEWHDISEADARSKLDQRLPSRMPEEKKAEVTDKIVDKMRERGVIIDDTEADIDLTEQPAAADKDATTTA
jgi:hypothetical protein